MAFPQQQQINDNFPLPPPPYHAPDYSSKIMQEQPSPPPPPPQIIQHLHPAQAVGPEPTALTCRTCHRNIVTRINYEPSTRTHLMAALLCACLCWPCVCLPYCIDSCKDANHYCPNCNAFFGTYKH